MLHYVLLLLHFVFLYQLNYCYGGRILVVAGTGSESHVYFFEGIIEALLINEHKVTFISHYKTSFENDNLKHVILPKNSKKLIVPNAFQSYNFKMMVSFVKHTPQNCVLDALKDPVVQEILQEGYDLIMISTFYADCFLSVAYNKSIPFVYVSYGSLMDPYEINVGNPVFPSIVSHKLLPFVYPLFFNERVMNVIYRISWSYAINYFLVDRMENLCREHHLCSEDMPSFRTLGRNASLTIVNSVKNLEIPVRPTIPNIIHVGGIHIKPTRPLPKELDDWLNQSGNAGVVYFSLGSAILSTHMKVKHFKIFVKVFSTLKQKVIWKWDDEEIVGLPPNIKISKWLPQQDILAHPNTRLFITHGGLQSLQEATYFGVPIIGLPVLGDQMNNVAEAVSGGWAKLLKWDSFTEDALRTAIQNILEENSFLNAATLRSTIMRDQLNSNEELVNYWTDYVIRYKGAKHLQSPFVNMSWFLIYNFDVWIFFALFFICILALLIFLLIKCFKMFLKSFKRKRD